MKKNLFIALCLVLSAFCAHAQPKCPNVDYIKANYAKYEYNVLMRDGKKLFTSVYVPKDQTKKYPICFKSVR